MRSDNNRGVVVGWSNIPRGSARGFLYTGGRMISLGLPPSAGSSHADAMNDAGSIVGSARTDPGSRALLWQNGTLADLNDLARLPPGVTLTQATAINNQGQICVVGRSGNTNCAYLLTPHFIKPIEYSAGPALPPQAGRYRSRGGSAKDGAGQRGTAALP